MRRLILIAAVLFCGSAHAWECNYWSQSSNPKGECYVAPKSSDANQTNVAQTQGQNQLQGQGQTQTATGGTGTARSSSSAVSTTSQGNSQVSQTYVAANVPNLGLPTQIIAGCGVSGSVGGANTKGAAILGVGFTTDECYAYIEAQAFWAIGDRQAACEVLHTTNSAKRSIARGAHLPSCEPVPPQVIHEIEYVNNGPTEAEIELRIQHAIADYIETHPDKPCPKPHHQHFQQTGCQMQVKVR
jgi:hypothetical protein